MERYINLQTDLYKMLLKNYPNIDFGMSGRLKSPFSHYSKVIKKFIDLFEKDEFKPVEILDDYAMKIFARSINYDITKVSVDSEGIYIDSNEDEFRIANNDVFEFDHNGAPLNIQVKKDRSNIWTKNSIPYISTNLNGEDIVLPLNEALVYKKSNKADLISYCYNFQKDVENFLCDNSFNTKKRKNYITTPKASGYEAIHSSFYSEELGLGLECQIKTQDMDNYSTLERTIGYKPHEKEISTNSLSKLSRFVLTTNFKGTGVQTYTMSNAECFEYLFGMPLAEYRKKMKPTLVPIINEPKIEGDSR